MKASISELVFGQLADGSTVKKYVLRNAKGTVATFSNLGASWLRFQRVGDEQSLVLGCETAEALIKQKAFLGATVGRFANRIKNGQFSLNGQLHQVDVNLPPHHLHGGVDGFSQKIWHSNIQLVDDAIPTLTFSYDSPDGEAGFPANVLTTVKITLTEQDSVRFEYSATADAATVFNLTNHSYFNLAGQLSGSLASHEFKIESDQFLVADELTLPNGEISPTDEIEFDFSQWQSAQQHLEPITNERLKKAGGYDHCYCYADDQQLKLLASARSTQHNVQMNCYSDLPGMQFYTANFLGGTPYNADVKYQSHSSFCFEPGFWPDSPNQAHFPDCTIDPQTPYSAIIEFSFQPLDNSL